MDSISITAWMQRMPAARVRRLFGGSPRQAADWVRLLALEGVAPAQVCYGRMLLEGSGVAQSAHEAFGWFARAARQDDLDGLNMLGRCLENGWGCDVDAAGAAAHFQSAADRGHAWAQYNVGHLYLDGIGVGRDLARAYHYYSRAAAQQHPRAMNLVGRCCEEGWGTAKDLALAADWYRRSAEAGYFRGQYNWASMLLAYRRFEEAARWFERAAQGGTPAVREAARHMADSIATGGGGRPIAEAATA